VYALFIKPDAQIFNLTYFSTLAIFDVTFRNGLSSGGNILSCGTNNNSIFSTFISVDGRATVGFLAPRANSLIPQVNTVYKVAISYTQGNEAAISQRNNNAAIDGISYPVSQNYSTLSSFTVDRLGIGCVQRNPTVTSIHNGRISRIVLFPFAISDVALTEITQP
jgi:hypothetical protein